MIWKVIDSIDPDVAEAMILSMTFGVSSVRMPKKNEIIVSMFLQLLFKG
jgi:hypothetical protein